MKASAEVRHAWQCPACRMRLMRHLRRQSPGFNWVQAENGILVNHNRNNKKQAPCLSRLKCDSSCARECRSLLRVDMKLPYCEPPACIHKLRNPTPCLHACGLAFAGQCFAALVIFCAQGRLSALLGAGGGCRTTCLDHTIQVLVGWQCATYLMHAQTSTESTVGGSKQRSIFPKAIFLTWPFSPLSPTLRSHPARLSPSLSRS